MLLTEMISLTGPIEIGARRLYVAEVIIATANFDYLEQMLIRAGYTIADLAEITAINSLFSKLTAADFQYSVPSREELGARGTLVEGTRLLIYIDLKE